MSFIKKFQYPVFFIVFFLMLLVAQTTFEKPDRVTADELRYIKYSVAIYKYGVFGLFEGRDASEAPKVGRANVPLYPSLIAGIMFIDSDFAESMICHVETKENEKCQKPFRLFYLAQILLALITLFFVFLIAKNLSQSEVVAWLAALLIVGSGVLSEFSSVFMTEILVLPFFSAFLFGCLKFYQTKYLRWIFFAALFLGLMTLSRPSFLYLFIGTMVFFSILATTKRDKLSVPSLLVVIITFISVITPWSLRNKAQFDSYALTHSEYSAIILIERTNYNQMSWPEVLTAFVYWLPDFGDSLSEKIFPEHLYKKLGWDNNSYYGQGAYDRLTKLSEELGSREKITGHIIRKEILTPKHIAVSVPLGMRGLYIAKYWGLVGLVSFLILLSSMMRKKDYRLLVVSLPALYMAAFHAGLSVSIPRYNLVLIIPYAISIAWYLEKYGRKTFTKISR